MRFLSFLFLFSALSLFGVDFDCVIVGTSPFSLFEALYQAKSGQRVLILEETAECGGSWKSVEVCGVPHADLGCHQIGHDQQLMCFLEQYAGCHLVSLDNPLKPYENRQKNPRGFYFSQGCFELIDHLLQLIRATDVTLLLNQKLENVCIDPSEEIATIVTPDHKYTTSKIILTPKSSFAIDGLAPPSHTSKYHHLYLLVQDDTPPKFCYYEKHIKQISRLMNLTHMVGLAQTGKQLLVIQTHNASTLMDPQAVLEALKANDLLDGKAWILQSDFLTYEQKGDLSPQIRKLSPKAQKIFEILSTGHIQNLSSYLSKWEAALEPWGE
jgi:hypothetical protein